MQYFINFHSPITELRGGRRVNSFDLEHCEIRDNLVILKLKDGEMAMVPLANVKAIIGCNDADLSCLVNPQESVTEALDEAPSVNNEVKVVKVEKVETKPTKKSSKKKAPPKGKKSSK